MSTLIANQSFVTALVAIMQSSAVLIAAAAGYLVLRSNQATQGAKIEAVEGRLDRGAAGGSGPVVVNVPPAHAAAGPQAPAVPGVLYPAWDQRVDVGVGGISATGAIDCGPECVAMCLRILTGVLVPASYLRWLTKGPGDTSLTTADDLVAMFAVNEHAAHRRDAPFDALRVELGNAMAKDMPAIVLGRWLSPEGHWMCCEQTDAVRGVLFRDPWGGPHYWVAWDRVRSQYQGTYVHVDERASYAA